MILAVVLAALLLLFILVRHHVGVPFLAMIAGLSVYDSFGASFAGTIHQWVPAVDTWIAQEVLYVTFVALIPILLYFRSGKSGFFGAIRYIEASIFAVLLTMLLAQPLSELLSFDTLAHDLLGWIDGIRGYIMVAGVILAYGDVFFYRSGKLS